MEDEYHQNPIQDSNGLLQVPVSVADLADGPPASATMSGDASNPNAADGGVEGVKEEDQERDRKNEERRKMYKEKKELEAQQAVQRQIQEQQQAEAEAQAQVQAQAEASAVQEAQEQQQQGEAAAAMQIDHREVQVDVNVDVDVNNHLQVDVNDVVNAAVNVDPSSILTSNISAEVVSAAAAAAAAYGGLLPDAEDIVQSQEIAQLSSNAVEVGVGVDVGDVNHHLNQHPSLVTGEAGVPVQVEVPATSVQNVTGVAATDDMDIPSVPPLPTTTNPDQDAAHVPGPPSSPSQNSASHLTHEEHLASRRQKDRERYASMTSEQRSVYNHKRREQYHRQSTTSRKKRRERERIRYHSLTNDKAKERNRRRAALERERYKKLSPEELSQRNAKRRARAAALRAKKKAEAAAAAGVTSPNAGVTVPGVGVVVPSVNSGVMDAVNAVTGVGTGVSAVMGMGVHPAAGMDPNDLNGTDVDMAAASASVAAAFEQQQVNAMHQTIPAMPSVMGHVDVSSVAQDVSHAMDHTDLANVNVPLSVPPGAVLPSGVEGDGGIMNGMVKDEDGNHHDHELTNDQVDQVQV